MGLWERVQLLMQVVTHPSAPYPNAYSSIVHQDAYPQPPSISQIEYFVSIVNQQTHLAEFLQINSGLAVHVLKQGDDPIDAINKMMSFLSTVGDGSSGSGRQSSFAAGILGTMANLQCPKPKRKRDATLFRDKVLLVEAQGSGKVLNEEELAFLADPGVAEGPAILMANLSSYGSDVLSEVPHSEYTHNDMPNQSVWEMNYSEQPHLVNHPETEINSDNNIIPYSEYLLETQNAVVNKDNLIANESLSVELETYKNRVKMLEERQNADLSTREKLIMDDMIREKKAQFADFEKEINSLKQKLFEQLKEKETLTKTFNVFKNESKEKEDKNIDKEIALEKKVKELDNINPFYLKKAQQIRPMLYDGNVITKETNVISIADSEETLMPEEESRSKMILKQSDLMVLEKKVNTKPIDYAALNRFSEDFGKCFVPQALFDEQALWLQNSYPINDQSASPPVKIEAPRELPKVSLVNTSLKKLKYHLGQFDVVVKKRITPAALTEGEWGFKHTKAVFQQEIIPFVKTLKDIFNVFDQDLLNEVTEVQTVQLDGSGYQIISQDIVNIVVIASMDMNKSMNVNENSFVAMNDSVNYVEQCNQELEAELIKQHNMEKVLAITTLENDLRKLKGKEIVDNVAQLSKATTIAPVEDANSLNPLDSASYSACKYVKLIQELLGYVRDTCPVIHNLSEKSVTAKPINKKKTVRFVEPVTSSSTSQKHIGSSKPQAKQITNNYMLTSTGVSRSTKSSRSKSKDNTKNDRILQISSSTKKNKVEDHSRIVKSCLNKTNCVVEPSGNANVQHFKLNTNSELMCVNCKRFMFDATHDLCFIEAWKPTGKVFTKIEYQWRPTGRTFTLVGNVCPLTRITATKKLPFRKPSPPKLVALEPVVTKIYTRRPNVPMIVGFSRKPRIAKSMISNKMELGTSRGSNASVAPTSSLINLRLSKFFCGILTPAAPSI
ncbi:hypothetical protein Tco_1132022 [Tanacetum coccineum]|uniref:Uncharacterized protein n=1 Tax=Tanacetum coccineum TaxID=301880 RepID=A0ABQ5JAR0_9ASTR